MNSFIVYKGVCTALKVDLTEYDFTSIAKLVLTIKNKADVKAPVIIEREFTEPKVYDVTISAEESLKLSHCAVYDFDKILKYDGMRYKETENGKVLLREGVGDCFE